jgi:hypothetical protein
LRNYFTTSIIFRKYEKLLALHYQLKPNKKKGDLSEFLPIWDSVKPTEQQKKRWRQHPCEENYLFKSIDLLIAQYTKQIADKKKKQSITTFFKKKAVPQDSEADSNDSEQSEAQTFVIDEPENVIDKPENDVTVQAAALNESVQSEAETMAISDSENEGLADQPITNRTKRQLEEFEKIQRIKGEITAIGIPKNTRDKTRIHHLQIDLIDAEQKLRKLKSDGKMSKKYRDSKRQKQEVRKVGRPTLEERYPDILQVIEDIAMGGEVAADPKRRSETLRALQSKCKLN